MRPRFTVHSEPSHPQSTFRLLSLPDFLFFPFALVAGKQGAYGILKRKLDPFNVVLLRSYLKIAPFLGGAYYLAVFFVQQKFRGFFPYAYFGAVAVLVAPAGIILLTN